MNTIRGAEGFNVCWTRFPVQFVYLSIIGPIHQVLQIQGFNEQRLKVYPMLRPNLDITYLQHFLQQGAEPYTEEKADYSGGAESLH